MAELEQLQEISQERNRVVYGWLRWLVLVAAGSFAALLGLMGSKPLEPIPFALLKTALLCQAGGILFGSAALYGEVFVMRGLAKQVGIKYINKLQGRHDAAASGANVFPLPPIYAFLEKICYVCLLLSLLCLAALVLML